MQKYFWRNLPRLPVPDLNSTLTKYLRCLKTILSSDEYQRTKNLVNQFYSSNSACQLQNLLIERAKQTENYIVDWWLDDMYLSSRLPLTINTNPAFVLPQEYYADQIDYLKFVSKFVSGILDYKIQIDNRTLPIDSIQNQTLCMNQYVDLLASHRIPGKERDQLKKISIKKQQHVIIVYRNHFFVLNVIENSKRINDEDIVRSLQGIIQLTEENAEGLGVLTSLPRTTWAEIRNELLKDELNRKSMNLIEQSIFFVCLDQSSDLKFKRNSISLAEQILHGGRNLINCSNRWYDKTLQFIFGNDGLVGVNFEHSPADGVVIIRLIENIYKSMLNQKENSFDYENLPMPCRLKWNLSEFIRDKIHFAKKNLQKSIHDLDLFILNFSNYGKQFPKTHQLSPDAFIQLAFQLTYYKMYKRLVSTYESASTRRFHLGRVDNIRANTPETLQWVKSMVNKTEQISMSDKYSLFKLAIQVQTDLIIQNIYGKGMDCHLLALKRIAEENALPIPEFYRHSSYELSNHFHLSTSQVSTNIPESFLCYGAVVPDGYGCSYNFKSDSMMICIASYAHCSTTNSREFAQYLTESLIEMYDLCMMNKDRQHPKLLHRL